MKKLLRTLQVYFPELVDVKFALMRFLRNARKVPFENDFNALALFPDTESALYLDVGANRGQSTDAIRMMRPNARICLFEPNELLFAKLQGMFGSDGRITMHNFGLGDESTEGVLVVPFYRGWMFDGLASFDRDSAGGWLKGRIFFYDERLLRLHESRCRIRTLDELQLAPFFMKLDIQGYEYKALKGAEKTLAAHEPVLLIESPNRTIRNFLKSLRYEFYAFDRGKFICGVTGSLNTFFMTTGKSRLVENYIERR